MLAIAQINKEEIYAEIELPLSKSIVNRKLIIEALNGKVKNKLFPFKSSDNNLLFKALYNSNEFIDFEDAGTPMRLFLAYCALINKKIVITGNQRLLQRPIAPLVEALNNLGAKIEYQGNNGFLPIKIINGVNLEFENVTIDGSLSSQFVSAILLIAPYFKNGLTIKVTGQKQSESYINTTIGVMQKYGIKILKTNYAILVKPQLYTLPNNDLEAIDWSAATFIYSIATMVKKADILIKNLLLNGLQGDEFTAELYKKFGIETLEQSNGIRIINNGKIAEEIIVDFTNTPDMFPAVVACCAALRIKGTFTGIQNLTLKESNRLEAMKHNLIQTGAILNMINDDKVDLSYNSKFLKTYHFKTYHDHRIAMACSIFAFQKDIIIDNEKVVAKSFENYWEVYKDLTQ